MISMIGSMIGDPICMDRVSARRLTSKHELEFVRLLVEVSVEESKRTEVVLFYESGERFEVPVIFEWLPWSYSYCGCFGHAENLCSQRPIKERMDIWKQKAKEAKEAKAAMAMAKIPSSAAPQVIAKIVPAHVREVVVPAEVSQSASPDSPDLPTGESPKEKEKEKDEEQVVDGQIGL